MFKPPIIYRVVRPLVRLILKTMFRLKVIGMENLPKGEPYMVIANHQSWLDPLVIMAYLPATPQVVVVAEKHGTTNISWISKIIRIFGNPVIGISRGNNNSRISGIKEMMKAVKQGKVLVVFPEGRLSRGEGEMYPFYPGAFLVSKKLGLPIVPIGFSGNFQLYLRKPITAKVNTPLYPIKGESAEDFAARTFYYLRDNLPSYPGDGPKKKYCTWLTNLLLGGRAPDSGVRTPVIRYKQQKDLFNHFS